MAGLIFYNDIDLLDSSKYRNTKIERVTDYSFATGTNSLPVTGNELLTGLKIKIDTGHTGSILATVMLLLHQQVKLVQTVFPGTVFVLIILKGP